MTREADELATRTVATVRGLQILSENEDDDGRALLQASMVLLAAVAAARAIGARAAARRFGRQDFTPTPVEPDKHSQMDSGLSTVFQAPSALPTMVRSEVVRAASDEFVLESIEIVNEPDFDIEDMQEDPENPEEYLDDDDDNFDSDDEPDNGDDDDDSDFVDEAEELEDEEEIELPPAPEPEKEWAHILRNDPDPCGRCKLAQGRRIKYPKQFTGIHPQCGCFTELQLVPIRLADKPIERNKK